MDTVGEAALSLAGWATASDPAILRRGSKWASRELVGVGIGVRERVWIIRDVLGNPFSVPTAFSPAILAFNDGAVVKRARVIYEERELPSGHLDVSRLAILADALEEAGCADPAVLGHLRGPGPHVLGCPVIDAVLGRG